MVSWGQDFGSSFDLPLLHHRNDPGSKSARGYLCQLYNGSLYVFWCGVSMLARGISFVSASPTVRCSRQKSRGLPGRAWTRRYLLRLYRLSRFQARCPARDEPSAVGGLAPLDDGKAHAVVATERAEDCAGLPRGDVSAAHANESRRLAEPILSAGSRSATFSGCTTEIAGAGRQWLKTQELLMVRKSKLRV